MIIVTEQYGEIAIDTTLAWDGGIRTFFGSSDDRMFYGQYLAPSHSFVIASITEGQASNILSADLDSALFDFDVPCIELSTSPINNKILERSHVSLSHRLIQEAA